MVARARFGTASDSNSSPLLTGSHGRASTGLGNQTNSSPPRFRNSTTAPSRNSAPRSKSATRTELALASPAAPHRATFTSSTVSKDSAAWRTKTSARPGARPAPTTIATPFSRAAESRSKSSWIVAVSSLAETHGTPPSSAHRAIAMSSPAGTAQATASTPAGSAICGCHSTISATSPIAPPTSAARAGRASAISNRSTPGVSTN